MFPLFNSGSQLGRCTDLGTEPGLAECGTRKHSLPPIPAAAEVEAGRGDLNLSPNAILVLRGATAPSWPSLVPRIVNSGSRWAREPAQVTTQVTGLIPIAAQSGGTSSHHPGKLVSFLFGNKKQHYSDAMGSLPQSLPSLKRNLFQFFFPFHV